MGQASGTEQMIQSGLSKSKMKNIYYLFWVDSILSIKRYHPEKTDWKISVFLLNTWINALNLWIIFIWLKFFNILNFSLLSINVFPGTMLNKFIAFSIIFAFPIGVLNYFFIFHKNRFKQLIEKYPTPPKKCAFIYSTIVALAAFVTAIIYGALS
ncbi:MAG: hypothetical protein FD181_3822 [Prolixibacteraceae bacterium]|nr:MAG: hypothetical protein FD181_3822 [Prolixibacteraceae bacterium]